MIPKQFRSNNYNMVRTQEDHSSGSTIAVENVKEVPAHRPFRLRNRRKSTARAPKNTHTKRVRFEESNNIVYRDNQRMRDECHETWYQEADFRRFKHDISHQLDSKDSKSLAEFKQALAELYFATKVDYEVRCVNKILKDDQKKAAKKLYKHATKFIGLELEIVASIREDIIDQREELQKVVADVQSEYNRGLWSPKEVHAEFRDSCLAFTQCPTLFAQLLAKGMHA